MIGHARILLLAVLITTTPTTLHAKPLLQSRSPQPTSTIVEALQVSTVDRVQARSQPTSLATTKPGTYVGPRVSPGHDNASPNYPLDAHSGWRDGWVLLNLCVNADGHVSDAIIARSSGAPEFEKATLAAAKDYQFSPATLNGVPVEHCGHQLLVRFRLENTPQGARSVFVRRWRDAQKSIESKAFADAAKIISEMQPWNSYESARLAILRMTLAQANGGHDEILRHATEALILDDNADAKGGLLEKRTVHDLRHVRFACEVALGRYAEAMTTYARLVRQNSQTPLEVDLYNKAIAVIDSEKAIATKGRLEQRADAENASPLWQTGLLRREFEFSNLVGNFDHFELRCDYTRFVSPLNETSTWQVPASWGRCELLVFGASGATLTLVEYPPAKTQSDDTALAKDPR